MVRYEWSWSIALALACGACGGPVCGDSTVQRLASRDRERQAVVVVRDCGSTADWSTLVLVGTTSHVDPVVVVGDTTASRSVPRFPLPSSGPKVLLEWVQPRTLMVTYDPRAELISPQRQAGDVEVLYRPENLAQ
ncbi:MAG TPA: hypothetical protein VF746_15495 [Longimicrobium sp.]